MKSIVTITFPRSGRVYQVATAAIAMHRANRQVIADPNRTLEQHANETVMLFADDGVAIRWAMENMAWKDIAPHAHIIEVFERDLGAEWTGATLELTDFPRPPKQLDDEAIVNSPLSLIISSMAAKGSPCHMLVLSDSNDPEHKSTGAIVLVQGPNDIVDGYVATITQFTQHLEKHGIIRMNLTPDDAMKLN